MNSKEEICNLALSRLGDMGSCENIDNPSKQTEIVCAKWYDVSRKTALRQLMPSFAKKRRRWALDASYEPAFGYKYAYMYHHDCLKVIGVGNLYEQRNDYAIEDGHILINEKFENGLPVRFIYDEKDISKFTDDFVSCFSWFLAKDICQELKENPQTLQMIESLLPQKIMEFCSVDSQENKPIRISRSSLMARRAGMVPFSRKA